MKKCNKCRQFLFTESEKRNHKCPPIHEVIITDWDDEYIYEVHAYDEAQAVEEVVDNADDEYTVIDSPVNTKVRLKGNTGWMEYTVSAEPKVEYYATEKENNNV